MGDTTEIGIGVAAFVVGLIVGVAGFEIMFSYDQQASHDRLDQLFEYDTLPATIRYRVNDNTTLGEIKGYYRDFKPIALDFYDAEMRMICRGLR